MSEITLYAFQSRSRAERVLWALTELRLDFKLIRLDYSSDDHRNSNFLAINPAGSVPTLVHNGKTYTESLAIISYVNGLSENSIIPECSQARYQYERWLSILCCDLEPFLWISDNVRFLSNRDLWPEQALPCCYASIERSTNRIAEHLSSSEFIAGREFSAADIFAYHLLTWARLYKIRQSSRIHEYLAKLEARPRFPNAMRSEGSPATTARIADRK